MDIRQRQTELLSELELFQDWTERYEYIIGLGRKLKPLAKDYKTEDRLIQGCQSQVWLRAYECDGLICFEADSDSVITKGMVALFVRVFDNQSAEAILTADMQFVEETGLRDHLAPTRANALSLMVKQMRKYALELSVKK